MADAPFVFFAGQNITRSGVYTVYHYQHRLPHVAVLDEGGSFPACNQCGTRVRFELLSTARPIQEDGDFINAASRAA
jgi:hypothetical protein